MKEEDFLKYAALSDLKRKLTEGIKILENYKNAYITVYHRDEAERYLDLSASIKDATINSKVLELLKERLKEVEQEMENI